MPRRLCRPSLLEPVFLCSLACERGAPPYDFGPSLGPCLISKYAKYFFATTLGEEEGRGGVAKQVPRRWNLLFRVLGNSSRDASRLSLLKQMNGF